MRKEKRKPILEGQPGDRTHAGEYRFVRFLGDGEAVFQEGKAGKEEIFVARPHGVASWAIVWRGTVWEFCRSAT